MVAVSNKNRFKFADDGPGVAVVIRNIIMLNRDEAEALSQLAELSRIYEEGLVFFCWNIWKCVRVMHIFVYKFNRIRIGTEGYFGRYGYGFRT